MSIPDTQRAGRRRTSDSVEQCISNVDQTFDRIGQILQSTSVDRGLTSSNANSHIRLLWLSIGMLVSLLFFVGIVAATQLVSSSIRMDILLERVSALERKAEKAESHTHRAPRRVVETEPVVRGKSKKPAFGAYGEYGDPDDRDYR